MSKSLLVMGCCLGALLFLACAKPEATTNREAAPSPATRAPSPAATTPTTASTGEKVGVAECDNFITAYENCVSTKVPAAAQAQLKTAITTWRTEWKRIADNPQTRGTLASICKTQLETSRTQMKAYGCTF
jgi:hypothetical protein